MKTLITLLYQVRGVFLILSIFIPFQLKAEGNWPKEIKNEKATIIIYQPQPDSMKGDHLYSRSAVSLTTPKITTPVFGAVWTDSRFSTDRESGTCTIFQVKILNVRFPGIDTIAPSKVAAFKKILEESAASTKLEFSLDELKSSMALNKAVVSSSSNFKNDPPEIIFTKQNSVLVLFDGDPVFKEIENSGLKRAINTPFLVLQDIKDKSYYLFGSDYWYKSTDPVKSAWTHIQNPPANVSNFYNEIKKQMDKEAGSATKAETKTSTGKTPDIPKIVVRTKPSELIQSNGEPKYALIQGTQLLYMTNTNDNIFMTIDKNQYYILISGRWYQSSALTGSWAYLASEKLPPDFAKIPEGSAKDIVLASIAGTAAAKDAVMDAQIPQTAAVDRKTAKCEVKYDGDPKFEKIKGTDLARGMNTSSTVLLCKNTYYVCDNAVWFTGNNPTGPWAVATSVPDEIQKIPPEDPSYHVKYVYIYDVQPDVVFIGYTPGYMGCYIYGNTVVYGTGWLYPPFYGPFYYPMPMTFGFGMHYNPWFGWSMGFSISFGWCAFSFFGPMHPWGGWWGPPRYFPPFHPPYNHYYGAVPPSYHGGNNTVIINNNRNTNIYAKRNDGSTKPVQQPLISTRTTGQKNNVYTDPKGDVYRNNNGSWQKNNGKSWEPAQTKQPVQTKQPGSSAGFNRQEMDMQNSARQRGTQNMNNRTSMQRSMPPGGGRLGGGGGIRH